MTGCTGTRCVADRRTLRTLWGRQQNRLRRQCALTASYDPKNRVNARSELHAQPSWGLPYMRPADSNPILPGRNRKSPIW